MKKVLVYILFCNIHCFCKAQQIILAHINIVNVNEGTVEKDQFVSLEKNRITAITKLPIGNGKANVYDLTGKYLIPGLWDMHIHNNDDSIFRSQYVPLFLANGVTGVRDMWGNAEMLTLKKEVEEGKFIGPRLVVGSPIIDGKTPFWQGSLAAATEDQGRKYVDSLTDAGYDFIKIFTLVREPVYLAIADECEKRRIDLVGHLPAEVGLEEALDAGQRSFEHNLNVVRYLTGKEPALLAWTHQYLDTATSIKYLQILYHNEPLNVGQKDFSLSPAVLQKMIQHHVAFVPTLTAIQGREIAVAEMLNRTKGLEYMDTSMMDFWKKSSIHTTIGLANTSGAAANYLCNKGVLILAGTDVNNPFCVPGFGLQQELLNLFNAGLTNLQVLQTATLNPAIYLHREQDLGTVSVGKLADLVILDENPLAAISNMQKIYAVVTNGTYLSKTQLNGILQQVKQKVGNR
jgi:imidazolonepropionase-like amidohydrolase